MAITSDGTQAFGIESSPVTINAVTYVAESLSFSYSGTRADINDSNGEPLGSTVIPGRLECSGTLQLSSTSVVSDVRGLEFTITSGSGSSTGTYLIVDASEAFSQGDYVKMSFNAYKKLN
tara:strand:+ start:2207 stop:2566 length:360 start_codon:yes stop_codon:yes gene_type:complete